jgi:ferritin
MLNKMKKNLLSKEYSNKITEAIGLELSASNLYKHLCNQLQNIGYFGSAEFFKRESKDELKHYQIWADFVNDKGGAAMIPTIKGFTDEISELKEAFDIYYKKEYDLGEFYNDWYMDCEDATIMQQLLTFVEIQRTSIGEAGDLLATLEQCGKEKAALLLFDKERNN